MEPKEECPFDPLVRIVGKPKDKWKRAARSVPVKDISTDWLTKEFLEIMGVSSPMSLD